MHTNKYIHIYIFIITLRFRDKQSSLLFLEKKGKPPPLGGGEKKEKKKSVPSPPPPSPTLNNLLEIDGVGVGGIRWVEKNPTLSPIYIEYI